MIERTHDDGATRSLARYSDCERYRYVLQRSWGSGPRLTWIMLNPSTATEEVNDPTIERCERRSRAAGAGAMAICNLFAFRATAPADLKRARQPFGADNAAAIDAWSRWADRIICAWGVHGAHRDAGPTLAAYLRSEGLPLYHLGLTKAGHPRHPLYVAYATTPALWEGSA